MKTLLLIIIGLIPSFVFYLFVSFCVWEFPFNAGDWQLLSRIFIGILFLIFFPFGIIISFYMKDEILEYFGIDKGE